MAYEFDLKIFFTPEQIAATFNTLPEMKIKVADLVFKNRRQHNFAHVGINELTEIATVVPVVYRGTKPVAFKGSKTSVSPVE